MSKSGESVGMDRRHFVSSSAARGFGSLLGRQINPASHAAEGGSGFKPIAIASANGLAATAKAMQMIQSGADALDAVIAGVNLVEDDPNEHYVGLGGLPNEDGVVELD